MRREVAETRLEVPKHNGIPSCKGITKRVSINQLHQLKGTVAGKEREPALSRFNKFVFVRAVLTFFDLVLNQILKVVGNEN